MSNLTYPYTADTPQGTQQINQTQVPIENNFEDIAQLFAVNHTPFNTVSSPNANVGLHNEVTYFAQAADPTPVAGAINMYSKAVAGDPNQYELFYQYPSGTVQQLTGQNIGTGSGSNSGVSSTIGAGGGVVTNSYGQSGYQYISGGVLMKWGYVQLYGYNNPSTSTTVFNFPVGSPLLAFSATPFHMEWQLFDAGFVPPYGIYSVLPTSATTFTANYNITSAYTVQFFWLAIGL